MLTTRWPELFAWPHTNKREPGDTFSDIPGRRANPNYLAIVLMMTSYCTREKHCPNARYYDSLSPPFKEKLIVKLFIKGKCKALHYFVLIDAIFDIDLDF